LFLEVFVPSGGILGFLSLGCSVFGVYGLFHQGHPFIGLGAILGIAIVTALGIRYGLRRLTFTGTLAVENPAIAPGESLPSLVGKEGVTQTALRPAGAATIDGRRVEVVSQGGFIEPNVRIRVIECSENRVLVKELRNA
jgi:membrane-bound ClpP family serine protease